MYSEKQVLELVAKGENSAVEFIAAAVRVRAESLAKEIVAFANTNGGTILIGVGDNGEIAGIGKGGKRDWEEWVSNISRQNVAPAVDLKIYTVLAQSKEILVVEVPKGKDKPYQTNQFQFHVRVGSTNRTATQQELMRLFQQGGVYHFDLTGVDRTGIKDINLTKIDEYFQRYEIDFTSEEDKENLLKNADILTEEGNATVAGLLVFGINPQKYLHFASISFAHFQGTEVTSELIDKQIIGGNLDYQVDQTLAIIKHNLMVPSTIKGAKRVDTRPMYPDKVFRELLVNACVHRNYAISGSGIRVFMFEDRAEFISPGKLPNTITIDKLKVGVSYAINPVIVKFMENLRYIDKLGRGLPMVWNEAKKLGNKVSFEEFGEEFKVVLYW